MVHGLLLAGLLAAPCLRRDDDTLDRIGRDLIDRMKTANAEKRDLKEADVLPLVERCWALYDQSEGEAYEFDVLSEVLRLGSEVSSPKLDEHWRDALKKVFTSFRDDDRIATLVLFIPARERLRKEADAQLSELARSTKNENVKAAFAYKKLMPLLDSDAMGDLPEADQKKLTDQLEALSKQYPKALVAGERPASTYEEFVARTLYAMEHLKVGAIAPEIEGKDLDGAPFKISDYRGKAVLLDFWGYW